MRRKSLGAVVRRGDEISALQRVRVIFLHGNTHTRKTSVTANVTICCNSRYGSIHDKSL
jgi:acetyltransferase-like isoleucine patch superfamily enzyme